GREQEERRLLEGKRAEAQELLRQGQAAFSREDWKEAEVRLASTLAAVSREPSLADLQTQAGDLLASARSRLDDQAQRAGARQKYRDFLDRRNEALRHGMVFAAGGLPINPKATREAAGKVLALFRVETA